MSISRGKEKNTIIKEKVLSVSNFGKLRSSISKAITDRHGAVVFFFVVLVTSSLEVINNTPSLLWYGIVIIVTINFLYQNYLIKVNEIEKNDKNDTSN